MKTRRMFSRLFALILTFVLFIAAAACSTGNTSTRPADEQISTAKETTAKETTAKATSAKETSSKETSAKESSAGNKITVKKDGSYTSKEEVAAYLHEFGRLPSNYITKKEAEEAGWISSKGNLWKVTDHKSIGGSRFMNYDEDLPTAKGRKYYECDIDYTGGKRNAKRIVYSNDGLIFYTEDHYESFEQLY